MTVPGLTFQVQEDIGIVRLTRAAKRNAINDELIAALGATFANLPDSVRAVVLDAEGSDFCAGLDLSDLAERSAVEGIHHSRNWHAALGLIQFGKVPVVAALHGAVIGGGLELASSCHVRIADTSTFYALPEGARGIFVGGGGSVRIPKLIGVARMTDMMLTGRTYSASEGEAAGFAQYLVPEGAAFQKAMAVARRIASNAPMTNYALIQALPRIAEQSTDHGLFTEALMSAIAQDAPIAKERVRAFLAGRAEKVQRA